MVSQPTVGKEKQRQKLYGVCTSYSTFPHVHATLESLC